MRKFLVVSGFLGAGKTTTMMALTDHLCKTGRKTVMITNDLGRKGLADYCYSSAAGIPSEEISGECICFVTENLVERLRRLYSDEQAELVMSDIPGFGVGALEHVYYKLRDMYPDECALAPFTVVTDASVLKKLIYEVDEVNCLLSSQLKEADLIVLNKTDLITSEEQAEYIDYLNNTFPGVTVIPVSAFTGEGISVLAEYLCENEAAFREPDFGVTEEEFEEAFGLLSEYNCQYYAEVCCDDFDANQYLTSLAEEIRSKLHSLGYDIPHLKLFAKSEDGDYSKVDLLGTGEDVILTHRMNSRQTSLPVVINTTARAKCIDLTKVIDQAILDVSGKFNLSVVIFYKESFGLNDEGRI